MKLLICTQVIDTEDPALGFFHRWVEQLSVHYERVTVICLKEGAHDLPQHVRVLSLGKERGVSRLGYVVRFFKYIWHERKEYDAVFVHMNEEYVLLGALLWKMFSKRVYLWRNHYAGSWRTRCAGWLSTKVFYTSQSSYTAQFKNAVQMPVGVDLERFKSLEGVTRKPHSVLFLGRISPSKKPDVLLEALGLLKKKGFEFTASFYGPIGEKDTVYARKVQERAVELGIADKVHFGGVLTHAETPRVYQEHEIYVNLADSGMYDKTLFEAAASGCVVLSTSKDFNALTNKASIITDSPEILADQIATKFLLCADGLSDFLLNKNSLESLGNRIKFELIQEYKYPQIIFVSLFDYPARYAHPIHGLKMAQAFVQIPRYEFTFMVNEVHKGSLPEHLRVFRAFGSWGRLVKKLHLRTSLLFVVFPYFLILRKVYGSKSVVFVNDPILVPMCVIFKMFFRYSLVVELHSLPKRFVQIFLRKTDSVIALTDSISFSVKRENASNTTCPPVAVVRNAVDVRSFENIQDALIQDLRTKFYISKTNFVIGYVGRFSPLGEDKGVGFLLEVLPMLDDKVIYLFVGGTKREIDTYQCVAQEIGVQDRVRFVGHVSSDEIPVYTSACDVLAYVPTSSSSFFLQETSPMKLFEYMASRRPIIASDLPTVREILAEEDAYLVPPGDKQKFIERVNCVLRNPKDAGCRAERAYNKVKENTWLQRAERILSTLEKKSYETP